MLASQVSLLSVSCRSQRINHGRAGATRKSLAAPAVVSLRAEQNHSRAVSCRSSTAETVLCVGIAFLACDRTRPARRAPDGAAPKTDPSLHSSDFDRQAFDAL